MNCPIAGQCYHETQGTDDANADIDADSGVKIQGGYSLPTRYRTDESEPGDSCRIEKDWKYREVQPTPISSVAYLQLLMFPYPNEYRAWTICRMPVWYPPIPIKAGGIQVKILKKMITRDASRRFSPYTTVPRAPVGSLKNISLFSHTTIIH